MTKDFLPRALRCEICEQYDLAENMVRAGMDSWIGDVHLDCLQVYNRSHEKEYSTQKDDRMKGSAL